MRTPDPLFDALFAALRVHGISPLHLDQAWPGVTDIPWVALLMYLVVFDFVDYWIHRGQHGLRWWWSLHALHHSQRQMTMWSDNRNHLLDDLLRDGILVLVAQAIGYSRYLAFDEGKQRFVEAFSAQYHALNVSALANVNDSSLYAYTGATLTLGAVTSYTDPFCFSNTCSTRALSASTADSPATVDAIMMPLRSAR